MNAEALPKPGSRTGIAPQILYLPDGGLVLSERPAGQIRLDNLQNGEDITLSGVFAERLGRHLDSPTTEPFPDLGPLLRRHAWLAQLQSSISPSVSSLLLGNGLGMLFIELTERCNERCVHCYAEASPERSDSLSREEIHRVLQEARTMGDPAVQFTGGDPLLHPELVFAVQTAHSLGYRTLEIYTNGLALSDALINRLSPYYPSFAFSIYAGDPAIHDAITQTPGSLTRTLKAMRRVQKAGLPLRVGIILMPENRGTQEATIAFLQQELGLDASSIGIDVVRSTGRGRYMPDGGPNLSGLQRFRHQPDSPQKDTSLTGSGIGKGGVRYGKLCIGAKGDVFPCIFSRRTRLGNIRDQSLTGILASLDHRAVSAPSIGRWRQCRESLSCSDCQAIAYLLGDGEAGAVSRIPIELEQTHATA
jgi:AdoMet-dependent heme synthase